MANCLQGGQLNGKMGAHLIMNAIKYIDSWHRRGKGAKVHLFQLWYRYDRYGGYHATWDKIIIISISIYFAWHVPSPSGGVIFFSQGAYRHART